MFSILLLISLILVIPTVLFVGVFVIAIFRIRKGNGPDEKIRMNEHIVAVLESKDKKEVIE